MEEYIAEIFESKSGKEGVSRDLLKDSVTGEYFYPLFSHTMNEKLEASLAKRPQDSPPPITAIIDTGLMHDHPMIKGRIIGEVDLTGEGTEDLNGHGTAVCLIYSMYLPDARLLNVKALNGDGFGRKKDLIEAFKWIIDWKKQNNIEEYISVNISAGIYSKKWFLFQCKGDCDLCAVANEAAANKMRIFAAAGNEHGKAACPSVAESVFSIASTKDNGDIFKNSGRGEIPSFGNIVFSVPGRFSKDQIEEKYRDLEKDQ